MKGTLQITVAKTGQKCIPFHTKVWVGTPRLLQNCMVLGHRILLLVFCLVM